MGGSPNDGAPSPSNLRPSPPPPVGSMPQPYHSPVTSDQYVMGLPIEPQLLPKGTHMYATSAPYSPPLPQQLPEGTYYHPASAPYPPPFPRQVLDGTVVHPAPAHYPHPSDYSMQPPEGEVETKSKIPLQPHAPRDLKYYECDSSCGQFFIGGIVTLFLGPFAYLPLLCWQPSAKKLKTGFALGVTVMLILQILFGIYFVRLMLA